MLHETESFQAYKNMGVLEFGGTALDDFGNVGWILAAEVESFCKAGAGWWKVVALSGLVNDTIACKHLSN